MRYVGLWAASALGLVVAAQAAAQEPTLTVESFSGTWSDHEDCRAPVRFQSDGRFVAVASGASGNWRLEGDTVVISAGDISQRVPMERLDRNRLRATETGVISYRCDGPDDTRSPDPDPASPSEG